MASADTKRSRRRRSTTTTTTTTTSHRTPRAAHALIVFGDDEGAAARVGELLSTPPHAVGACTGRLPGGAVVAVRLLTESTAARDAWQIVSRVAADLARARMPSAARE